MENNNNDAIAARRRALAEALRQGDDVVVTPSGEVDFQSEVEKNGQTGIQVPDGKLATDSFVCDKCGCRMILKIYGDSTPCKADGCDGTMHRVK